MKILVVGGAGYIGSHMVQMLLASDHEVTIFDNLSTGFHQPANKGLFIQGDLANPNELNQVFEEHLFDCVMHFAAFSQVAESVTQPGHYYKNNFCNTLNLLDAMVQHGVNNIIFSSTAALFGNPRYTPIDEKHPCQPINPYGHSKLMIEQALADYEQAYGIKYISLRYFNAAGASLDGSIGERHDPETHLIPIILQVAAGKREHVKIFGRDYSTPDGTCIRDYIHVIDLCQAHLLSLEYLLGEQQSNLFNLGNNSGYSVAEVIQAAKKVTQKQISTINAPRRAGDPEKLVADSERIKHILGWRPHYSEIETIIQHAWQWQTKNL